MEPVRRAAALFAAGRLAEAQALCLEALGAGDGRDFNALHLLSVIAARLGNPGECVRLATRALEIEPRHAQALCNRGAALRLIGRHEEALADYDRALAIDPAAAEAWNNRGVALAALGRLADARASYDRALSIDARYDRARFNRALARLALGDFPGGFADHEARFTGAEGARAPRSFAQPRWSGREPLAGRTLLLHAEQGLGDAIQFCRYAPLAAARGAAVVVEVHAPLAPLLAQLEGVSRVVAIGDALPPFDLHCPLMSLPLAFGTLPSSIPAQVPYLRADDGHVAQWRSRLGARRRPRVGLAWSGNPFQANDGNRSMALARLHPLRDLPFDFFALQKDIREGDRAAAREWPALVVPGEGIADFRDTAALVHEMDLVVSVCTSLAHLAGAMAKPVWILLPEPADWRWLVGREDSPWYPTARLFRQPAPGDWSAVVARVRGELLAWNGAPARQTPHGAGGAVCPS